MCCKFSMTTRFRKMNFSAEGAFAPCRAAHSRCSPRRRNVRVFQLANLFAGAILSVLAVNSWAQNKPKIALPKSPPPKSVAKPREEPSALTLLRPQTRAYLKTKTGTADTERHGATAVEAGKAVTLRRIQDSGIVTALTIKIEPADRYTLRQTLLRIYWDGAASPAIEVPLGDFFGTPFGDSRFQSLLLASQDKGFSCFFPMPFRNEMRVELANTGKTTLSKVDWKIAYTALKKLPSDADYLHAQWRRGKTGEHTAAILWYLEGKGRLAGMVLALQANEPVAEWLHSPDFKLRIFGANGETILASRYDAWFGISEPTTRNATAPVLRGRIDAGGIIGRIGTYRQFLADAPRMDSVGNLELTLPVDADIAATTFWYETKPEATAANRASSECLTVTPYRFKDALEAESLQWTSGNPVKTEDRGFRGEASGSAGMLLAADSTAEFSVETEDVYTANMAVMLKRGTAQKYRYAFDGAPFDEINQAEIDPLSAEETRLWITSVPLRLTRGKHTLRLQPMDGKPLFLDYLDLMPSIKTAGVIEAESFLTTAIASKPSTLERDDMQAEFSGNSFLRWDNIGANAELTVSVDVKNAGNYLLELGVIRDANSPKLTVKWDGKEIGDADAFVSNRDIQPEAVTAGILKDVAAGKHTLTLIAHAPRVGKTSGLNWDWIRLKPREP